MMRLMTSKLIRHAGLVFMLAFHGSSIAQEINLDIRPGQQEVYEHSARIERIAIADPGVVNVSLMNSKTILITPKAIGTTQLSLWEKKTQVKPTLVINLRVDQSSELEQAVLSALDSSGMEIQTYGNTFLLDGKISSLETHSQAVDLLEQESRKIIDLTESDFDSHVQIDIKVVEVSRQNVMRFGFFLGKNNRDNPTLAISSPGNLSAVESAGGNGFNFLSNSGFLPTLNAFNLVMGNKGSGLLGTLSILESNGFAYTIAEPSLSAISGQTANFLAGGEFPVPIRSGSGSDGAVTIVFKEYGVRLLLTPTVLDKNRIFMKVSPEVSELDFSNAVQSGGVSVPGLRVRRTDTSISLGDGESFVISGMVSRNTMNNIDKFPGLGNLPIIGAFFQSKRFDRDDKELLMVVTPRLVRPIARDAKLPELPGQEFRNYNPTFGEFFLSNDVLPKPPMGMSN